VKHRQSPEFQAAYGKHAPLGRMMDIGEIHGIVEFLISDKATYCTGGVYNVDGGWTAW
jgi:NAD(P)-dependent dehydrogenase (short-subunit alcohol dehydrogenase family)